MGGGHYFNIIFDNLCRNTTNSRGLLSIEVINLLKDLYNWGPSEVESTDGACPFELYKGIKFTFYWMTAALVSNPSLCQFFVSLLTHCSVQLLDISALHVLPSCSFILVSTQFNEKWSDGLPSAHSIVLASAYHHITCQGWCPNDQWRTCRFWGNDSFQILLDWASL